MFDHPLFAFLEELHVEFGVPIDLYLFLEQELDGRRWTLRNVSDHLREDFERAPWLRLGPHGLDDGHAPYLQTPRQQRRVFDAIYAQIDRFAGHGHRSEWVRLHCFSEPLELAEHWRERGVTTLLLTDKPAVSYRLADEDRRELEERGVVVHKRLHLRRTHERVEGLVVEGLSGTEVAQRLVRHIERHGFIVLFTHEACLDHEPVRAMCRHCLRVVRDYR